MDRITKTLKKNVAIMKSSVSKYAVYGVIIAFTAIILATIFSGYFEYGEISLTAFIDSQKKNTTLWFLDAMPFIFAFWGQYSSQMMAYEASAFVLDQTSELRNKTAVLEYKAAHDATHDAITDLPNRILMLDRLDQAIHTASRQKVKLAFLIIDIDNFKEVNDTLGHYNGDRLLKQIVSRLLGVVRQSDTLARIGGDEFAILLPAVNENKGILRFIKKVQKAFEAQFVIEGLAFEIQSSIGVSIFPDHGNDLDTILQRANVAMYAAQQNSKKYAIYSSGMDKHSPQRLTLTGELRQAMENNDLVLHFQPKINLRTKKINSLEALVRWQHPLHGLMFPDDFIPMAERTGLIKPLSDWVLKNALEQSTRWREERRNLNIAINLSPTTFLDSELPDTIIGILALYDVPASSITFEITEGSMIKDPELAMEILTRLAHHGIKISIDDFGTGYSSLAYLKKLPASEIKIDKSFVIDMLASENDAVIVKSIIDLGHNLGLKVVGEGVENKETALQLKKLGCDVLQGYYFSKPLKNIDLSNWFSSQYR